MLIILDDLWKRAKYKYGKNKEHRNTLSYDCEKEENPEECRSYQEGYKKQFKEILERTNKEFIQKLDDLKTIWVKEETRIETRVVDLSFLLTSKEKSILAFIKKHPGCKLDEIVKGTETSSRAVKEILPKLILYDLIVKIGTDTDANYLII